MNTSIVLDRPGGAAPAPAAAPLASLDPNTPIFKAQWGDFGLPPSDSHQRRLVQRGVIAAPLKFSPRKLYYRLETLLEYRDRSPERRDAAWWRGLVKDALDYIDHPLSRPEHVQAAREKLDGMGLSEKAARIAARWTIEQVLASDAYRKAKATT